MKLLSIEVENFRPYRGRQRIAFAGLGPENVSLLYGTNGAGKTTLLHAFMWALYGELSQDMEQQERLINDNVWQEAPTGARVSTAVTVEFEHFDRVFRVRREVTGEKAGQDQRLPRSQVFMSERTSDGASKEIASPESQIDKILPHRLSRFFFVNGERIEHLVRRDAYTEIQDAIKTLLGLEQLERALRHLPATAQKLRHLLKSDDAHSSGIEALTAEIDDIDRDIEQLDAEREALTHEEGHLKQEIEDINDRLRQLAGARELQRSRDTLEKRLQATAAALRIRQRERTNLLGERGYLAFLGELPQQILASCDRLRQRGDLPAPIKRTFIEDLLEDGTCICGTHLIQDSDARRKIEDWRERTGIAEVEAAWNSLNSSVRHLDEQRAVVIESLQNADVGIGDALDEERRLTEELSEISRQIKKLPLEEVEKLENLRGDMLEALTRCSQKLGSANDRLQELKRRRNDTLERIDHLQVKGEANQRVQRRVAVVKEVEEALQRIRDIATDATRRKLDTKIRDIFDHVSLKRYEPRLTRTFQLELWQQIGDDRVPAPKSTGENMLLSLSFVAAIAAACRDAAQSGDSLFGGVGGDFPVVMDAAFGNLDDDYRRQVANFLPRMTSQVIVLTSKAQITGVAEQQLHPRIGKRYVITTHTTKRDLEDVTEQISVNGRDYSYQVVGSSWDGAELTEVEQ